MKPIEFCINCSNPMDKVGKYCIACVKKKQYQTNKLYLKETIKQGLCYMCRKPLDRCGARCAKCNKIHYTREMKTYYNKIQNKLCPKCKIPVTGNLTHCPSCNLQKNKRQRELRNLKKLNAGKEQINA